MFDNFKGVSQFFLQDQWIKKYNENLMKEIETRQGWEKI